MIMLHHTFHLAYHATATLALTAFIVTTFTFIVLALPGLATALAFTIPMSFRYHEALIHKLHGVSVVRR